VGGGVKKRGNKTASRSSKRETNFWVEYPRDGNRPEAKRRQGASCREINKEEGPVEGAGRRNAQKRDQGRHPF